MLVIDVNHWNLAEEYFRSHTENLKFIPDTKSSYCFIKAQDGNIYAMARKNFRTDDYFVLSSFVTVVKVQNQNNDEFTCQISKSKTETKRKNYSILQKLQGQSLKQIFADISTKKRTLLYTLEKDMIALKVTMALINLHSQGKIHGHISPYTIIVNLENDIAVSLLEFDSSLRLQKDNMNHNKDRLTHLRQYWAPEVVVDGRYSFASDYYSLGVVFKALNRPHWAVNLMSIPPDSRANLHEILLDIFLKIINENAQLSESHAQLVDDAESLLLNYFRKRLEEGVSFDYLIRNNLVKNFLGDKIVYVFALNLCLSYHMAFKERPRTRIYNPSNFIVKIIDETLEVAFNSEDTTLDTTLAPPEYKDNIYSDRSAVFFLSKMIEFLGLTHEQGLHADYHARPDIVSFLKDLYFAAKRETPPEENQAALSKIHTYLLQEKPQPLIMFTFSEDDSESDDDKLTPSRAQDSSSFRARSDDREELIFEMEGLEANLDACTLTPAQNLLTQYPTRAASAASSNISIDKDYVAQTSDKTKAFGKITLYK